MDPDHASNFEPKPKNTKINVSDTLVNNPKKPKFSFRRELDDQPKRRFEGLKAINIMANVSNSRRKAREWHPEVPKKPMEAINRKEQLQKSKEPEIIISAMKRSKKITQKENDMPKFSAKIKSNQKIKNRKEDQSLAKIGQMDNLRAMLEKRRLQGQAPPRKASLFD